MNKKNCIFTLVGLFVLMMMAASVSADEENEPVLLGRENADPDNFVADETSSTDDEPNLIAPAPDEEPNLIAPAPDEEPALIAPMDAIENQDASTEGNSTAIIFVAGIVGAVVLITALIIIKKKT